MMTNRHRSFAELLQHRRGTAALTPNEVDIRAEHGVRGGPLTQEELAARTWHDTSHGLSAKAIGTLERGEHARPHLRTLRLLADALGLTGPDRVEFFDVAGRQEPGAIRPATAADQALRGRGLHGDRNLTRGPMWQGSAYIPTHHPVPGRYDVESVAQGDVTAAERCIMSELGHLGRDIQALHLLPNHVGIRVTLPNDDGCFVVKPMPLNSETLSLSTASVERWLEAADMVVPMWWDEVRNEVHWANLLEQLIRIGGLSLRERVSFQPGNDLVLLDRHAKPTVSAFLRQVGVLARAWPTLRQQLRQPFLMDPRFPVTLIDALKHPHVLSYLPINCDLSATLNAYTAGRGHDRTIMVLDMLHAAEHSLRPEIGPEAAAGWLADRYEVRDREVRERLAADLLSWTRRIAADPSQRETGATLRAFKQLISILSYRTDSDLNLPRFISTYTFPLGKLMSLFPPMALFDPLESILTHSANPRTLRHAAYYLGILDFGRGRLDAWTRVRDFRRVVHSRRESITDGAWPLVDRQLLFTEAQLGSQAAKGEYHKALQHREVIFFEMLLHFDYYARNIALLKWNADYRIAENRTTDEHVREILSLSYEYFRTVVSQTPHLLHQRLDPQYWLSATSYTG